MTPQIKSKIIRMDLESISYSKIADEVGVSKTTVFNVINDYLKKVNASYVEEIKFFLTEVRKSGISIQDCVKGFRTYQLLRAFKIKDEFEEWIDKEEDDIFYPEDIDPAVNNITDNFDDDKSFPCVKKGIDNRKEEADKKKKTKKYSIEDFISDLYDECRTHNIKPDTIIKWMLDLFDFFSYTDQNKVIDKLNIYSTLEIGKTPNISNDAVVYDKDEKEDKNEDDKTAELIPFVSRVASFIEQKKNYIKYLDKIKKSLGNNIETLTSKKNFIKNELDKAIRNKNQVISYFTWYESLKTELYQKQKISLTDYIDNMVNIINDFKNFNFDATRIIKKYEEINSLATEKESVEIQIAYKEKLKNDMELKIVDLEEQANFYKQTINTSNELLKHGLGLKELKQLTNLIYESALANNIDVKSSIQKFFKDVEDHYDDKLGLEKEVNDLIEKKKKLEKEVPEYESYLKYKGIVSSKLIHLQSCGVTNEDIIGMNHLVLEFKNSDFLSDPFQKPFQNNNATDSLDNTSYWYQFVSKLSRLKNINTKINKRISELKQLNTKKVN
ncbi:MAG: helix-turn-helix domain-containing protein [Candidatus Nitrosocosmicus sp.]